jgi:hypothetical protein
VTDGLDIRSARSLSLGERAGLFNAAYEGYLLPFHLDEQQLAAMDEAFDLDLDASRIASATASLSASGTSAYAVRTRGSAASASSRRRDGRVWARR